MNFTTSTAYRAKYSRKSEPNADKLPRLCDFVTSVVETNTTQHSTIDHGWTSVRTRRSKPKATLKLTPKTPKVSIAEPATITFPSLSRSCIETTVGPKKAYLTGWSKVAATSKTDFIATEKAELVAMRKEAERLRAQIKEAKEKLPKVDVKKEVNENKNDYFFTDFDDGMAWGDIVEEELGMM